MKRIGTRFCLSMAVVLAASVGYAEQPVDPSLPIYQRVEGLSGKITLTGSDTMAQIAAIWGDSFRNLYPTVEIDIQVKGARDAVPSVINGEATFGLLSRQVTQEEVKAFHDRFGYVPTVLTPSLEPLAVFVHKDNPIESLSLSQLDALFSTSLRRGEKKTAATWGDVGVNGNWANVPVVCRLRSDDTGSQVFVQAVILGGGTFRTDTAGHTSHPDMVRAIAGDPRSVGFAGISHAVPGVKAVPLAWRNGDPAIDIETPGYPLVRPLQLVVNNPPNKEMSKLEQEFIKYVFSKQGQEDVVKGGFQHIPAAAARIALDAADLSVLN